MNARSFAVLSAFLLAVFSIAFAQSTPHAPNSDVTYQTLRRLLPGGETATVQQLTLIFMTDPRGAFGVSPEEVELMAWNDTRNGIWMASHYTS
jgi:hypothetical protein